MAEGPNADATVSNSRSNSHPATELIHLTYEGNFQLECDATLLSCQVLENNRVELVLDQTTMHPQGGGQPTDKGTIRGGSPLSIVNIDKVTVDRASGIVTHAGSLALETDGTVPPTTTLPTVVVGERVHVSVDEKERMILSECHTAGHVVDSAMARCNRILPPSKGYHFLDGPYVEYKGSIPPDERDELLKNLQTAFNELVEEDIETKIETMSKGAAEELCNRVQENFNLDDFGDGDDVRIVTVAGWPCPCGGTHVRSTKFLKERKWGVVGIKSKKGVVRVKYDKGTTT